MPSKSTWDAYVNIVRRALQHLYDPATLRHSPLFDLLGLPASADRVGTLRKTLQDAVQALKPDPRVPSDSNVVRIYEILTYRFIEQSSQKEVAADMALSIRQLQRLEGMALETLGNYLIDRYSVNLDRIAFESDQTIESQIEENQTPDELIQREKIAQELAWLESSSRAEEIDIKAFLQDTLETIAPLIQKQAITIESDFPDSLCYAMGDPIILRQVFLTLLSTFVHTCPGSQVSICCRPKGEFLSVEIQATQPKDTRPAWSERENELLQQLVKLTGAEFTVHQQPGNISLATLRLPGRRCHSILALDDNADALALLERYLSGSLYRFSGKRDPNEFLAEVDSSLPDAIILDIMLPGVDGWQILGRIKTNPKTSAIPVIVSTILPQESLALMLGADAFLRKPFNRRELLTVLKQLLQGAQQ